LYTRLSKSQEEKNECATFDFPGFTHFCDKTRNGNFKVGRKTSSKKLRQKIKEMNQWLKGIRNRVKQKVWWRVLRQKLRGHYLYYGMSGNTQGIKKPKIYHLTYTLFKGRGCVPEEPDEGKPQVRFCEGAHSNLGANTPSGGGL
jgi:hypothetical protein